MIQHLAAAERLARAERRFIESGEVATNGVEDGTEIELAGWKNVLGRLPAFGKVSEIDQRELLDALLERCGAGQRRAFLEAAFEAFRRSGIRARQVFDDFDHRPLPRIATDSRFIAGAAGGVEEDREATFQMSGHGFGGSVQ